MKFLLLAFLLIPPRSQAFTTSPSGGSAGASPHCFLEDGGGRVSRQQQQHRCRLATRDHRRSAPATTAPRRPPPVRPASTAVAGSASSSSTTRLSLWSGGTGGDEILSSLLFLGWDSSSTADAAGTATADLVSSSSSSSWRQYASVAVIGLVLLDIVLGSPVANSVLQNARNSIDEDETEPGRPKDAAAATTPSGSVDSRPRGSRTTGGGLPSNRNSKPRIDVDAVAKQALDKAEGVTMLREYLDSRKTDWDRMEDLKRKMDQQMAQLDEQQRERNKE